jgi:hypothetical protein
MMSDSVALLAEVNHLRPLVAKIVEPMRRAHVEFCKDKSDAELIENWSKWYIGIENTILWNVEYPREAEMLDKLYDADYRNRELSEILHECLQSGIFPTEMEERAKKTLSENTNPDGSITKELREERDRLLEAIKLHHSQKADDLCVMDDNDLYHAAGLPSRDNHIGDPEAMLANCKRFIAQRCQAGGPWKSYAELEAEVEKLKKFKEYVHKRLDEAGVPHDPDPEHNKQHGCRIEGRLNWCFESDGEKEQLKAELVAAQQALGDWHPKAPVEGVPTGDKLVDRLRGIYTVPVRDGAGPLNGKTTFTRTFAVGPINMQAASEIEKLRTLILKLLHDAADRYKIFKAEQFNCPHMRALAKAVNFDNSLRPV